MSHVPVVDRYFSNLIDDNPFRSPNRLAAQALEELAPRDLDAWLRDRREILLICYLAMRQEEPQPMASVIPLPERAS